MGIPLSNEEIYNRIYAAINARKLLPGVKLSEEKLSALFHVGRARIREVLFRLSQEHIIDLLPNRGAFVATPSVKDCEEVFAVRKTLEHAIVHHLACRHADTVRDSLREHLVEEEKARARGDRMELAQLTGHFHVLLAELTDNRIYAESLRRLVALTGLIISVLSSESSESCPDHEHREIVAAINASNPVLAQELMARHLEHVQKSLAGKTDEPKEIDLRAVLGL